jgi:pimeloyl-ACP methyl ester carboxylesterase
MPFVDRQNARIHWTSVGKGEPVVLLMGLGCSSALWFRVLPHLRRKHRVILIDNRGAGLTTVDLFVVHGVGNMAADVAAVLDAAGESSAHLLGFSMGGMIAQQFAIDFPGRVLSLTLAGTNCGWANAVKPRENVWRLLFEKGNRTPEENLAAMQPYTYARSTPQELIDEDQAIRVANFPALREYQAQLYGLIGWSSFLKLPRLTCPTLILHGTEDHLIPVANGRILHQQIINSEYVELEDASHWLHTDQNAKFVSAVKRHLLKNSLVKPQA